MIQRDFFSSVTPATMSITATADSEDFCIGGSRTDVIESKRSAVFRLSASADRYGHFEDIANNLNFQTQRVRTMVELISALSLGLIKPQLVVLDHSLVRDLDLDKITATLNTIIDFRHGRRDATDIPLALRIEQPLDRHELRRLKSLGFRGIVPSTDDFNFYLELKAHEELLGGREYWPPECVKKNSEPSKVRSEDACGIRLTERQQQVQRLLCERGLSNKAIARHLNISESTVKIHVSAILKRYAVRNRTQLALAVKNHSRL